MLAEEILSKIADDFDAVEVYVEESKSEEFELKNAKEFSKGLEEKKGCGIRAVKNGKFAAGWFSGFDSPDDIVNEIKSSIELAKDADAEIIPKEPSVFSEEKEEFESIESTEAEELLKETVEKIGRFDKRVKQTKSIGLGISYKRFEIANSYGLKVKGSVGSAQAAAEVLAEDKIADLGYFHLDADRLENIDFDFLAEKSASIAVNKLYPKPIQTKKYSVIIENSVFRDMLAHFISAFSAYGLINHTTPFEGKLNEKVFSDCITIIDAKSFKNRPYALAFDQEGNRREDTVIVENGVLKTFMHNSYTSSKLKQKNTANAKRNSLASVDVGPFNFYVKPSDMPFEKLLNMVDGVYITEIMGLHMANAVSGDFSLGINGFLIHNGELVSYFKSATFADNFYDMIKRIIAVSDNLYFAGSVGCVDVAVADCVIGESNG